jgi:hypothetical protein
MKSSALMSVTIVALAWTLSESSVIGQDAAAPPATKKTTPAIEISPFVSMDSRGGTPIGTAVSFPLGSGFSLESEGGYRRGEGGMHALSSHASLLYDLPRVGRAVPYLACGVGLAQYGKPLLWRDGTVIGTQPNIALEVNAGGGVKVPVSDAWAMRTDARWFKPFGRGTTEHWRVSHGVGVRVGKR